MSARSHPEVEAGFREVERDLDRVLDAALLGLRQRGVVVEDRSNRSGFHDSFFWEYAFRQDNRWEGEIRRRSASISYCESWIGGEERRVGIAWRGEVFGLCKPSRISVGEREVRVLDEVLSSDFEELVLGLLGKAEMALAGHKGLYVSERG